MAQTRVKGTGTKTVVLEPDSPNLSEVSPQHRILEFVETKLTEDEKKGSPVRQKSSNENYPPEEQAMTMLQNALEYNRHLVDNLEDENRSLRAKAEKQREELEAERSTTKALSTQAANLQMEIRAAKLNQRDSLGGNEGDTAQVERLKAERQELLKLTSELNQTVVAMEEQHLADMEKLSSVEQQIANAKAWEHEAKVLREELVHAQETESGLRTDTAQRLQQMADEQEAIRRLTGQASQLSGQVQILQQQVEHVTRQRDMEARGKLTAAKMLEEALEKIRKLERKNAKLKEAVDALMPISEADSSPSQRSPSQSRSPKKSKSKGKGKRGRAGDGAWHPTTPEPRKPVGIDYDYGPPRTPTNHSNNAPPGNQMSYQTSPPTPPMPSRPHAAVTPVQGSIVVVETKGRGGKTYTRAVEVTPTSKKKKSRKKSSSTSNSSSGSAKSSSAKSSSHKSASTSESGSSS